MIMSKDHRFSLTLIIRTVNDMKTITLPDIERIGRSIDERGLAAVPSAELLAVARTARQLGGSAVLAAVLADATEPDVARIRAFGLLGYTFSNPRPVLRAA
jgi:hypothetical protein